MLGWYKNKYDPEPIESPDELYQEMRNFSFPEDRRIAYEVVDGATVSTVFLALAHGLIGEEPVLYETMVFCAEGSNWNEYCERYSTYGDAQEGHRRVVNAIMTGQTAPGSD